MPAPIDRDILRLTSIVTIAERIRSRLDCLTREQFVADRNEIDMVAYRLGSIGEYVNRLSPELKLRHPTIEWRRIYDMRNALFHDYDGAMPGHLWYAAGAPLSALTIVCADELAAKLANPDWPDVWP